MLSILRDLFETRRWTLVVPLAVVTELDGLKVNPPPLGRDASEALRFLETSVRDPSTRMQSRYLKVQTSRGNYLTDLSIRSEAIEFSGTGDGPRNLDDVILRAAVWRDEHYIGRSHAHAIDEGAAKVSLVTFDRNLRVKARASGVDVVGDADLTRLVLQTQPLSRDEADKG